MALPGLPGSSRGSRSTDRSPNSEPAVPANPDWPQQATASIVNVVDKVRDKTTGPAITAARVAVYGTVIVLLLLPIFVFLLVGSMRLYERILIWIAIKMNWSWLLDPMWIVYLTFGTGFALAGMWCWGRAKHLPDPEPTA
jgi:hypothetical protein